MRRISHLIAAVVVMTASAHNAEGSGLNPNGIATLSWSATSSVSNVNPPAGTVGKLYVRLDSVTSVRAITARIAWTPDGGTDGAYALTNWSVSSHSLCTWILKGTVTTIHEATDSTLHVTATGASTSTCTSGNVMYLNFADSTGSAPTAGRFRLMEVTVLDANGNDDHLTLGGPATVSSGSLEPAPLLATIFPATGWTGRAIPFTLTGYNFRDSVKVRLRRSGYSDILGTMDRDDSHNMQVTFPTFAAADTGVWKLIASNGGSKWTTLYTDVTIAPSIELVLSLSRKKATSLSSHAASLARGTPREGSAERSAILKLRANDLPLTGLTRKSLAELEGATPEVVNALRDVGVRSLRCLWPELQPQNTTFNHQEGVRRLHDFGRYFVIDFDSRAARDEGLARLMLNPAVESATPNQLLQLSDANECTPSVPPYHYLVPDDPNVHLQRYQFGQWYLKLGTEYGSGDPDDNPIFYKYGSYRYAGDTKALSAWNDNISATGHSNVTLAIIDSGVDTTHADLNHTYSNGTWGKRIRPGINYLDAYSADDVFDDNGHGTAIAGIAGARTDTGVSYTLKGLAMGIAGIAGGQGTFANTMDSAGVRILPIKVFDDSGFGELADAVSGINWAAAKGAKVINLSFAVNEPLGETDASLKPLRDALDNALQLGSTCVAAMGNRASYVPNYPARFAEWGLCIAVGSSDLCGARVVFPSDPDSAGTALGDWEDLIAPGFLMRTTYPTQGLATEYPYAMSHYYDTDFATSWAAGTVSGIAASLASVNPALNDVDVKALLRKTSYTYYGYSEGHRVVHHQAAQALINPEGSNARSLTGGTLVSPTVHAVSNGMSLVLKKAEGTGLADQTVTANRHELRFRGALPYQYSEAPFAWVRVNGTNTWNAANPHVFNYGSGFVDAVTVDSVKLGAYVYYIPSLDTWVPCTIGAATLAYRAAGRIPAGTTDAGVGPGRSLISLRATPNPANAMVGMQFAFRGEPREPVSVTLYSAAGRRVRTFEAVTDPEGQAAWHWDGKDRGGRLASSGVYFARVMQSQQTRVSRIVLLR